MIWALATHERVAPRTVLLRIALLALAIRIVLEMLGLASTMAHHTHMHALGLWWQWDAHPYMRIAQVGYRAKSMPGGSPFDEYYMGFFPFYPFAVKAFALVLHNRVLAGLCVSYAATVFGAWFLYLHVRLDSDHDDAWRTVLLLFSFPTAYFLAAPYSEALFLFAVTGATYAARKGMWGRASLSGVIATGTRVNGLSLLPALAAEAVLGGTKRVRRLGWTALTTAGFAVFLLVSQVIAHDPLRYFHLQSTHWGQSTVAPWRPVVEAVGSLVHGTGSLLAFVFVNRLAAIAFAVPLLILAVYRLRVPDWVYGWAGFLPLLFTGWLTALPRFLLTLYPLFMVEAQLTRSRRVLIPVLVAGAALQCFFFWRYAGGEWTF
jgi:Gpi18-like mannosyltransferase